MTKRFMFWLWCYVEKKDFSDSWPSWLWSWLLLKLDKYHGWDEMECTNEQCGATIEYPHD